MVNNVLLYSKPSSAFTKPYASNSISASMYAAMMKEYPVHTTMPKLSVKADKAAYMYFFFLSSVLNVISMNTRPSIRNRLMKLSPLYTSAAVLAMLPLDILTKSIASKPRFLLFERYFAR